jgi:hypothetical protein
MDEHLPGKSDLILYRTEDGQTRIEVRLADETVWMTQAAMAELYQGTKQNISLHLKNIFADNELQEDRVVKEYLTTASDGKKYRTRFYNLEAIISVGYRVNSIRGTQFRIWATDVLRNHILKGYSANKKRLKELKQSLKVVGKVLDRYQVDSDQAKAQYPFLVDYIEVNDGQN